MPTLIPDGYGQFTMHIQPPGPGGEQIITWGVDIDAAGSTQDAADQMLTIVNGLWSTLASPDYSFTQLDLTVGAASPPYFTGSVAGGGAGGSSGAFTPPASAVNVRKLSATPGRPGRGRFFWPGLVLDSGVLETGLIDDTPLAGLQSAFDDFLQDIADSDDMVSMVLLHSDTSPVAVPSPVFALSVQPQLTWLRSRQH